jgi:predicted HTH domain antitoxin
MTLTLPDSAIPAEMRPAQLRLELACALYAQGKLTKVRGAELAGVDFFTFQQALKEREISTYTVDDLEREVATLSEPVSGPFAVPAQGMTCWWSPTRRFCSICAASPMSFGQKLLFGWRQPSKRKCSAWPAKLPETRQWHVVS